MNIPKYLQNSKLYMEIDDNSHFDCPNMFLKPNDEINTFSDWIHLFNTFEYWNVFEISDKVKRYQHENSEKIFKYIIDEKSHINNKYKMEDLLLIYKSIDGYSILGLDINSLNIFISIKDYIKITFLNLENSIELKIVDSKFYDNLAFFIENKIDNNLVFFIENLKKNINCSYSFKKKNEVYLLQYKPKCNLMKFTIINIQKSFIFNYSNDIFK